MVDCSMVEILTLCAASFALAPLLGDTGAGGGDHPRTCGDAGDTLDDDARKMASAIFCANDRTSNRVSDRYYYQNQRIR